MPDGLQINKWRVRLGGRPADLKELAFLVDQSELCIVEEGCNQYLSGSILDRELDSMTDDFEAYDRVAALLGPIYGAVKLNFAGFKGPYVVAIYRRDEKGAYLLIPIDLLGPLSPPDVVYPGTRKVADEIHRREKSDFATRYSVSNRNTHVYTALRLFGLYGVSWDNLYKIYETIRDDLGVEIFNQGWCTEKEIRLFKQTANSSQAIGDAARHAFMSAEAPKHPLALSDASTLIKNILVKWIRFKSEQ